MRESIFRALLFCAGMYAVGGVELWLYVACFAIIFAGSMIDVMVSGKK